MLPRPPVSKPSERDSPGGDESDDCRSQDLRTFEPAGWSWLSSPPGESFLELQFPRFANQLHAKGLVRFLMSETKAGSFIKMTSGSKDVIRPKYDFTISGLPGETHTLSHKAFADPKSSRSWFYQQKPKLGYSREMCASLLHRPRSNRLKPFWLARDPRLSLRLWLALMLCLSHPTGLAPIPRMSSRSWARSIHFYGSNRLGSRAMHCLSRSLCSVVNPVGVGLVRSLT
jgi:hypothetical protein